VIIENKQAIEMTNIYSNILSSMMDAFASIISNNLNIVMKFLTSITIILSVPTLISSIYGMNVHLPFQESEYAFAIVMGLSIIISLVLVFIFIHKKYF
ncbi:MAG TPA: magnesium transporter CorA family protein, partial [Candidatus Cloacimonas sp.]|nr:magnesium transporter CorA family protein [Candidatus Cloacimonas sp.]